MTFYEITDFDRELIEIGMKAQRAGFVPGVHDHTVGCALRCANGSIYKGINCDGIHGTCAEYVAIGSAIADGQKQFDTIVAVHDNVKNFVIPPCGNCRQMMMKYCPDVKVILNDENGELIKVKASDLLPYAWKNVPFEQ